MTPGTKWYALFVNSAIIDRKVRVEGGRIQVEFSAWLEEKGRLIMNRILLFILMIFILSASSTAQTEYVPDSKAPAEIKKFIPPGNKLLALESADLNGDGLQDYILVLEKQKANESDPDIDIDQRPLWIIIRTKEGSLQIVKKNEKVVFCSTCGGVMGDPFQGVEVGLKTFTVNHYGGSGWRWSKSFRFNYSRIDDTWQLVRVEETSFHSSTPEKVTKKIYTPPQHFGKIDISDFDPENYLSKGAK